MKKAKMLFIVVQLLLLYKINSESFYGIKPTITYNIDAMDCMYNDTIEIPFYEYIYESVINCYGHLCNITETFFPVIQLE